jgi:hypothetical protein
VTLSPYRHNQEPIPTDIEIAQAASRAIFGGHKAMIHEMKEIRRKTAQAIHDLSINQGERNEIRRLYGVKDAKR